MVSPASPRSVVKSPGRATMAARSPASNMNRPLPSAAASRAAVRVWDLPTRLFHWCLAAAIVTLVITGRTGGDAMAWHFRAGFVVMALLLFRLVWGFIGGHWSRFVRFWPSPRRMAGYLRGDPAAFGGAGHNPLGALSVYAMLLVLAVQVGTGLFSDDEISSTGPLSAFAPEDWVSALSRYHRNIGQWLVIGLVVLHLLAVLYYAVIRRHRLVGAMVHGDVHLDVPQPPSRDDLRSRVLALVVLALCFAFVGWVSRLG